MAIRNYNGETFRTITVAELIERLQDEDPDALVVFSTNYGDYHNTPQALPLRGEIEESQIEKSAYSNSGFALATSDEDGSLDEAGYGEADEARVLVIR